MDPWRISLFHGASRFIEPDAHSCRFGLRAVLGLDVSAFPIPADEYGQPCNLGYAGVSGAAVQIGRERFFVCE